MTPGGKLTPTSTTTTCKGSPELKMPANADKGGPPATAKSSRDKLKDKQGGKKTGSPPGSKKGREIRKDVKNLNLPPSTSEESDPEQPEVTFEDYSELCERVAKTMYYVNPRQKCTPRPSLPLTILAVDTFSKYGRKDTLEFLDVDMAAEIGRNACVSPTALVFALVYLERLSVNNPGYLKTVKPSELFVVSLLVASKFVLDDDEDLGVFNDEWATSANMELKRVNQLELEFLTAIDWQVNISSHDYSLALSKVEAKLSLSQGIKRGWFTYTELQNSYLLSASPLLPLLYQKISEVISGLCIMYTTFFCTLITTSALSPYLLSISTKLVLLSSMLNSQNSCLSTEDNMGMGNVSLSIPLSQTTHVTSTLPPNHPLHPRIGGVPQQTHNLLQSLEEQENQTEISEQILNQISSHGGKFVNNHRVFQTANANLMSEEGKYSYKCEGGGGGGGCEDSEDDALGKVKRVLENLLQQSYQPTYQYPHQQNYQQSQFSSLKCVGGGGGGGGFGNALCAI